MRVNRCSRALQFHHIDPSTKTKDNWGPLLSPVARATIEAHPEHFELLCANCHFEEHAARDEAKHTHATCGICGEQFRTSPSALRNGRKYCSDKCRYVARNARASGAAWIMAKINARLRRGPTCWEWTGTLAGGRTPVLQMISPDGRKTMHTVARYLYELEHGPLPDNNQLVRKCHNLRCIRPHPEHCAPGIPKRLRQRA